MSPRHKDQKGGHGQKKSNSNPNSEEYRRKRERNNQAVKKSRVKSKIRTQQTLERVQQLKQENEKLEEKIKLLTKELSFLKDLFLAHAGSTHGAGMDNMDLETFLVAEPGASVPDILKGSSLENESSEANRIHTLQAGERLHLKEESEELMDFQYRRA